MVAGSFLMWLLLRSSLRRAKKKKRLVYYPLFHISKYLKGSTSTFEGQHPHVDTRQLTIGDLQLLQRVGKVGGEGVVFLGHDGELLLGLFYLSGADWSQFGERDAARVAPSLRQASH